MPNGKKTNGNDFGEKFNEAKKSGAKTFNYGGKSYTTTTAQEIAKKQSMAQNLESAKKAESKAKEKGYLNKGLNKIADSYSNEYGKQWIDKYGKKNK